MTGRKHLSEKKKASNQRYLDTLDEVKVRMPKGRKLQIKNIAASCGMSLNAFILEAVNDMIRKKCLGEDNPDLSDHKTDRSRR